ncbi:ribosome silencing factor [Vibrio sp.]|nr:ribosome silencing factor [Vibrio sp.]
MQKERLSKESLRDFIADKADDMKAVDLVTLDVQGKSSVTDFMVVCTGTSKRHVASIADHVAKESKLIGHDPLGLDGEVEGEWIVLDLGTTMLHVLQEQHRELYQLEKLWA